ncbi:MAG: energy transducer TonB, partial [Thiomicrospira sp.]|uniref:energy transducer TonB n=1 Tax=Thiomicrospira sp. TaxID=935 RepID=UPI0019FC7108
PQPQPEPESLASQFSQYEIERAEKRYVRELSETLMRHAQDTYPMMAKRRQWQGQITLRFTIRADGSITNLAVVDSSGRQILDEAALSIFTERMQMFFKAFPEEIQRKEWRHTVPIEYKLR